MPDEPRVLIVEDNDVLRVMLFTILRNQPLAVDTASSGDEALEKVLMCDYALMLVDLDLASGEAYEFLRLFRERRPEATTFVIGVRNPATDVVIDASMIAALLHKPVDLTTLADVVRECAAVVPPPEDPLRCPPAESESRLQDRAYLAN